MLRCDTGAKSTCIYRILERKREREKKGVMSLSFIVLNRTLPRGVNRSLLVDKVGVMSQQRKVAESGYYIFS